MNIEQVRLARHALGLPKDDGRSYRNRFVASKGGDNETEWDDLVSKGLAFRGGDDRSMVGFCLTEQGAIMVLEGKETLCPEEFPGSPRAWKPKRR
jgi:hypothetical protein